MRIDRVWCMPNKETFKMQPIKNLFLDENVNGKWIDPFPFPFKKDALDYLKEFESGTVRGVLFDPPYSPRQLKECYDSMGQSLHDTKSSVWAAWKNEIARVIQPRGSCISFGWNTNGLGLKRGFRITRILLIAHGGMHNDTICVVEEKEEKP